MTKESLGPRLRLCLLTLGSSAVAAAAGLRIPVHADELLAAATPAASVTAASATALLAGGAALASWHALTAAGELLALAARSRGRPRNALEAFLRRFGAPLFRGLAVTGIGVAVGLGASPSAVAVPDDLGWGTEASAPASAAAVVTAREPAPPAGPGPGSGSDHEPGSGVRVRPGDSLWAIAGQALVARGLPAGVAEIAGEWPRWYAANRGLIGPDPDLIHPGQFLTPPPEGAQP